MQRPSFKLSETRFSEPTQYENCVKVSDNFMLYYGLQPNVGWRFVVEQAGNYSIVGKIYKTKDEILSDVESYANSWGVY